MSQARHPSSTPAIWALILLLCAVPSAHASGNPVIMLPIFWNLGILICSIVAVFKVRASMPVRWLKAVLIAAWIGANWGMWQGPASDPNWLFFFLSPLVLVAIAWLSDRR